MEQLVSPLPAKIINRIPENQMLSQVEPSYPTLLFQGATGLHKGDRPYQQDQVAIIPHHYVQGCILGVVADGMGGKTGGRTASNQVIQTAKQLFTSFSPHHDDPDVLLRQIANETHLIVRLTSVTSEEEPHTTFAAFLILPNNRVHISHCGDSRVYLFNKNNLIYRTHDHSYVQSLVDAGKITEKEALSHPKSNLITSCLGIFMDQGPSISQYTSEILTPGYALLACSDGLWHGITKEELGWAISKLPPKEACQKLVEQAYKRANGHSDNISIAIVSISGYA